MNHPIIIEQVSNGFIVNAAPMDRGICYDRTGAHVFESMESLKNYIEGYFKSASDKD